VQIRDVALRGVKILSSAARDSFSLPASEHCTLIFVEDPGSTKAALNREEHKHALDYGIPAIRL
jgi:hypothetical protein